MTKVLKQTSDPVFPAHDIKFSSLALWSQQLFTSYASTLDMHISSLSSKDWYKKIGCKALKFFENQGAVSVESISYRMMQNATYAYPYVCNSALRNFARYIGDLTSRPFLHYIVSREYTERLIWDKKGEFKQLATGGISITRFVTLADRLYEYRINHGYSESYARSSLTLKPDFCLFLAANDLLFSLAVGKRWCQIISQPPYKLNTKEHYNSLCWIDALASGHSPSERLIFFNSKKAAKQPPMWAKSAVDKFLAERKQDQMAEATISMSSRCIVKFLWYLDEKGISALNQISVDLIKSFNLESKGHKNAYSKNAYNVRIRQFLRWLYVGGIIDCDLGRALPINSAPQVRPVQILTKEQQDCIDTYCQQNTNSSRIYYRDVAVIKLMRYMGLRASDVAELRFSSINLTTQILNLNQRKTGKVLLLPIPTHVLNSIITYIEKERPTPLVKTDIIFLSCNAPFGKLKRNHIEYSVIRVLGCGQSHMLRRTFATELMTGQTDLSLIAQALGHSDNHNVHKYLNTDQKRMQSCSLSLLGMEYHGSLL